jgi:hypothetical protein
MIAEAEPLVGSGEIESFVSLVKQGVDAFQKAGEVLNKFSRTNKNAYRMIMEKHPEISISTLETFARIGRKEIHPPLLVDGSIGAQRLLECPYETQVRFHKEPIEVAVKWDGKTIKTEKRRFCDLTKSEANIVFTDGTMNTLEQQAFRIREKASSPPVETRESGLKTTDLGHFSIVFKDGKLECKPCGKSPISQPVRLIENSQGYKSAVLALYSLSK